MTKRRTAAGSQPSSIALEDAAWKIEPPVNFGSTPQMVMICLIQPRRVSLFVSTALNTPYFGRGAVFHTIFMVKILGAVKVCMYRASNTDFGSD